MNEYEGLFNGMHPGFFERENIRALPEGEIFSEMILPLGEFDGSKYDRDLDGGVFGEKIITDFVTGVIIWQR